MSYVDSYSSRGSGAEMSFSDYQGLVVDDDKEEPLIVGDIEPMKPRRLRVKRVVAAVIVGLIALALIVLAIALPIALTNPPVRREIVASISKLAKPVEVLAAGATSNTNARLVGGASQGGVARVVNRITGRVWSGSIIGVRHVLVPASAVRSLRRGARRGGFTNPRHLVLSTWENGKEVRRHVSSYYVSRDYDRRVSRKRRHNMAVLILKRSVEGGAVVALMPASTSLETVGTAGSMYSWASSKTLQHASMSVTKCPFSRNFYSEGSFRRRAYPDTFCSKSLSPAPDGWKCSSGVRGSPMTVIMSSKLYLAGMMTSVCRGKSKSDTFVSIKTMRWWLDPILQRAKPILATHVTTRSRVRKSRNQFKRAGMKLRHYRGKRPTVEPSGELVLPGQQGK
mmetsp:Transcript_146850/g.208157  ORF Transcript_146850/g.208157 Transcript_146850/m.208157 type:complete len:396 (+) Transcript_146850:73-1260(+)